MGTNVCSACSRNEKKKKTASNTSQSSLLLPASPTWNIISFRAKVESQIAYFQRIWAHFRKASVCIIFRGALSFLWPPCFWMPDWHPYQEQRCLQEIGCYSIHISMLRWYIFHEICKWGQQDRDILDDRIFNRFWGTTCFPLKSQFTFFFFFFFFDACLLQSDPATLAQSPPQHVVRKRYLLFYKLVSRNTSC